MKLSRIAASGLGLGIAAVSVIAFAAPASAATPGVTYVTAAQISTTNGAGAAGWNNIGTGLVASTVSGLTAQYDTLLTYGFATPLAADSGSAFVDLSDSTYVTSSTNDELVPYIYWLDPSNTLQVFSAAVDGANQFGDTSADWFSSVAIDSTNFGTLGDFDDAFSNDPSFAGSTIVSAGFYVDAVVTGSTIYTFGSNGEDFSFMPVPVVTGAPATLGQVDYGTATKGWNVATTGFVPLETVTIYVGTPSAGGPLTTVTADANGAVSYKWVGATTAEELGAYQFAFVGDDSGAFQTFEFALVAQAALAATGSDVEAPLIAGGILLLGGAALALVAVKRRTLA